MEKIKAFAYMRVSTQTQAEKGGGLDIQRRDILEYASTNDFEIVDWFIDEGISGTKIERLGLASMFNALEQNKDIKKIIVLNVSRLWRDDTIGGLIRYTLQKNKADIISIQEQNYTLYENNASSFLINSIMQALAQYDRMLINQKLAAGRSVKASKGFKPCGAAPYGYRWQGGKIEIDYNNNLIVVDIFKYFAKCKSYEKTALYCKEQNYKTKRGGDFTRQSIKAIINNDFYLGIVQHKGEKIKGSHPAIIPPELWRLCNQ